MQSTRTTRRVPFAIFIKYKNDIALHAFILSFASVIIGGRVGCTYRRLSRAVGGNRYCGLNSGGRDDGSQVGRVGFG